MPAERDLESTRLINMYAGEMQNSFVQERSSTGEGETQDDVEPIGSSRPSEVMQAGDATIASDEPEQEGAEHELPPGDSAPDPQALTQVGPDET